MTPPRRLLAAFALALAVLPAGGAEAASVVDNRPFLMRLFGFGRENDVGTQPGGAKVIKVPSKPARPKPVVNPKNAVGALSSAQVRWPSLLRFASATGMCGCMCRSA